MSRQKWKILHRNRLNRHGAQQHSKLSLTLKAFHLVAAGWILQCGTGGER
jgi:hypothetical protein